MTKIAPSALAEDADRTLGNALLCLLQLLLGHRQFTDIESRTVFQHGDRTKEADMTKPVMQSNEFIDFRTSNLTDT